MVLLWANRKEDAMKKLLAGIITTALLFWCIAAHAYSAFFRYEEGKRIDYSTGNLKGEETTDKMPKNTLLHISTNPDGKTAKVSITYGKNQNAFQQDLEWTAYVIKYSEDMISLMAIFGDESNKIDQYVIYPKHGNGFILTHSAYLGDPLAKILNANNSEFPYGTAMIFRIKQFKE
jgi:hypothetical protein